MVVQDIGPGGKATEKAGGEADGVQWSPEGVQWEQAPLKKVGRCVEKLCLDPKQRKALERTPHDAKALNAEGILDMARAEMQWR